MPPPHLKNNDRLRYFLFFIVQYKINCAINLSIHQFLQKFFLCVCVCVCVCHLYLINKFYLYMCGC